MPEHTGIGECLQAALGEPIPVDRYCFACQTPHPAGQRCPAQRPWGGRATQDTKTRLLLRDGHACQNCGRGVTRAEAHTDHKTPRAMGGSDRDSNLQILCATCNLAKGNG